MAEHAQDVPDSGIVNLVILIARKTITYVHIGWILGSLMPLCIQEPPAANPFAIHVPLLLLQYIPFVSIVPTQNLHTTSEIQRSPPAGSLREP
jgi:hypothetical protein